MGEGFHDIFVDIILACSFIWSRKDECHNMDQTKATLAEEKISDIGIGKLGKKKRSCFQRQAFDILEKVLGRKVLNE